MSITGWCWLRWLHSESASASIESPLLTVAARWLAALAVFVRTSGALDLANASRLGWASFCGEHRFEDRAARELGGLAGGTAIRRRSPRVPHGMDGAAAARSAAGEWGAVNTVENPSVLLDFYRKRGARYFADLGNARDDPKPNGLA